MADAGAIIGDVVAPYALIASAQRYIGTLIFDVTVREVHTDEFTITTHPVETGTPISDHYFANPKIVEITAASSDSTGGYTGYAQVVYEAMQALAATRDVFSVSTGKRFYPNMMFANFTVVTDDTSEFALMVTARLQEVIMTSTSGGTTPDGSGGTAASQADPSDTAPETAGGTVTPVLAPSTNLPTFAQGTGSGVTGSSIGSASSVPTFAQSFNT